METQSLTSNLCAAPGVVKAVDTARHGYLGCVLTEQFGAEFAKGLLDAHEDDSLAAFGFGKRRDGNQCCEKLMDLYNNQIGIDMAGEPGYCEDKVLNSTGSVILCAESSGRQPQSS